MSAYTDERDAAGRRVFYILEVTLDQCANNYTFSPCSVSDAGDGARCFYSYATCQDRENFSKGSQTWRFISGHVEPQDIPTIWASWPVLYPILGKLTQDEQEVSVFGGFTRQEKRKFSLGDIVGNSGNDLVPDLQPGKSSLALANSTRKKSFWRRMIAIHPNYVGRDCTLYQGFVTSTFTTGNLKTLWKGKLSGLSIAKDGGVTLEAEDLFGDFEKKLPAKIGKRNTVQTTIGRTATSVVVRDGTEYTDPTTAPGSFTVARVKTVSGNYELVKVTGISTNTLTVTRGAYGTTAEPWVGDDQIKAGKGTRVEEVLHYSTDDGLDGLLPMDVVTDLLERAGIDSGDIDSTSEAEAKKWIGPWKVKRTVSKPVQVKKLVQEILELYQGAVFIDDDRKVKFWISRPEDPTETVGTLTDTNILDMGAQYEQGEDRRLTHASVAYGYDGDEDKSGAGVVIYFNDEAFQDNFFGVGESNRYERALKGGRWVQPWDEYQAAAACALWAKRSERGRERLTFHVDLRDESDLVVGSLVTATTDYMQDEFGANRSVRCVVISRKRVSDGRYRVTIEATGLGVEDGAQDSQGFALIGPSGMVDYDSDTAANQADYGYASDANDFLGAADDRAKLIP